MFETVWHKWLRRPYRLAVRIDAGNGMPVVALHGIGSSSRVWQPLQKRLQTEQFRLVAFDLLGFGDSPKPDWPSYDIDTHATAVIAALRRKRLKEPVVLIGHSLGALVALRVARLQPNLVRHTILYEMPLYEGLPEKRRYKARLAVYYKFYEWVIEQQPGSGKGMQRFYERVGSKLAGLKITAETWQPLVKTLKNSIMKQTAAEDIKQLRMAADVIYGSRDMLVIRGKVATIFGADTKNITAHTIKENHRITAQAANFLAERIIAYEQGAVISND